MPTTNEPLKIELREPSTTEDSTALSSSSCPDVPGPYERVASAGKVLALAILPTAALGIVLAFCPDVGHGLFFLVQIALIYATTFGGASVIMRWLALGASPFLDRAATAPVFAVALAATVEFAARMFDPEVGSFVGARLTIPFAGTMGLYWSLAATSLPRDGAAKRTRRRRTLLDLSLSLLLLGLYAAALRWSIGELDLDAERAVQAIALGTASFAAIGLIPFGIDLVCWYAVRSQARAIFLGIGILTFLCALSWSLLQLARWNDDVPFFVFAGACYLPLSAAIAALIAWRPLLPMLRGLDERRRSRGANGDVLPAQDVPLSRSSAKE